MSARAPRSEPRRLASAIPRTLDASAPATALARLQRIWRAAAGPVIAAQAEPVRERRGVVTIACRTAAWAAELDLRQAELMERIEELLGADSVASLRFTADRPPTPPADSPDAQSTT